MEQRSIYAQIADRTDGTVYIGVVGPVRTGKSTFIKRFMEQLVLPNIENIYERERATDELPQSGSGRTIMTAEPKFVPNEAARISPDGKTTLQVRLIDSVGYMIPGAVGDTEDGKPRMVTTPWASEELPMAQAAELGTKKVMEEHSSIGVVVTTDGTVTDIPREDYREAANRFPRDKTPVFEQFDEHTARLMLGGEVLYMGKYSCIAYTDGIPTMLVVCDETVMTFYIENGVIAAVSWMAPEEAMRLPITEQEAQQRMTIDPSLLTDENLHSILIGPEIALVNDGFTFDSPEDLSSEQLFMLFLYWSDYTYTRDNYKQADGKYHFTESFVNSVLRYHFRDGSFTFDITQCGNYDASDGTAVIENVSGFGGGPDLRIADVQVLGGSTVQVTADFYNADPFLDGSGGELRYARKVYTLDFYYGGALFQSARFAPLPEDDLRAALQLHTGETTDDLAQLFWTYDSQNGNLLGSLPSGNWTALPLTEDAWDGLSLFVYERWARENNWPLTISETDFDHTLVRYFPLGRYGWEDRSSHYLTYQDGTYTRTINDNHGARYCYLKRISCMADGSFQLVFRCLDVPELTEYADASADVRAVYDHAGAEELQPQEFRRAVYRAFADGVIPTGNSMTELTVTVRLTGEARYPFRFLSASA